MIIFPFLRYEIKLRTFFTPYQIFNGNPFFLAATRSTRTTATRLHFSFLHSARFESRIDVELQVFKKKTL